MARTDVSLPQARRFGETSRRDAWWLPTGLTFLGLLAFVIYATWGALQNQHYYFSGGGAGYLSPFYSPLLWDVPGHVSGHAGFGPKPEWWPAFIPFFPAFFILWMPGGFRVTCYYYRGAYYKSFWADPPACGVGEPRKGYRGEEKLPLILQNVHRFLLYFALLFIVVLAHDAWKGFRFADENGDLHFGMGVGSLVLLMNVILLGGYTFGCHSLRHLIGGRLNSLAGRPVQKRAYSCVSCLNRGHMRWAWASLFWVAFTDLYVRLCSAGVITDVRFF